MFYLLFFLWGIPSIISDLKADVRDRRTATRALVPKLGLLWEAQLVQTSSLCCSHSGSLSAEKRGDFVMETQLCWVKLFVTYRSWGNWVLFFFNNAFGLLRNIISKTGQKVFRVVLPTFSTGVGCICFRLLLRNLPYKFFIFSSNEAFPRHLVKERGKQVTVNKASVIHPWRTAAQWSKTHLQAF